MTQHLVFTLMVMNAAVSFHTDVQVLGSTWTGPGQEFWLTRAYHSTRNFAHPRWRAEHGATFFQQRDAQQGRWRMSSWVWRKPDEGPYDRWMRGCSRQESM